jgi:capsular exopolysaccharide synthesis family protein
MERIQQAIARARAARGDAPVRTHAPAAAGGPPAIAEAWARLPPFVADTRRLKAGRIVTPFGGQEATAFDVVRTKTLQTMRANGWKRLAITSASPGCGKSTVTLNLAYSLARQPDVRAIVTELDLRRPSLARTLGVTPRAGIADVLEGRAAFAEQALCHGGNLALSLSTGPVRNPAELLNSTALSGQLEAIEAEYAPDLTIFDMPPMLVSDDMMAFAGQVDCVLMIAAAEATTVKEIDICERELARQTNFMGVILNKCRYMGEEYGYSYYG